MAQLPEHSPLGKPAAYLDRYDPSLLYPLPRGPKRGEIGIAGTLPFLGADLWTLYELSWLNPKGKPQLAIGHVTVPAQSSHIIESKSFKLYLNSFNNTVFANPAEVQARLRADLSQAVWHGGAVQCSVGVTLLMPEQFDQQAIHEIDGLDLDRLDVDCTTVSTPDPLLLRACQGEQPVTETLTSRLLKSNCLVTGQPDWGSVQIRYSGPQIDQAGLLQYIVGFRNHHEFHEQCVERIYMDIWQRCRPAQLSVYARYTRRGGLDINPYRTSHPGGMPTNVRTARQ